MNVFQDTIREYIFISLVEVLFKPIFGKSFVLSQVMKVIDKLRVFAVQDKLFYPIKLFLFGSSSELSTTKE